MFIKKIRLACSDIKKQQQFYEEILGFSVIESKEEIRIVCGSTILEFYERKDTNAFYHFAFNIPAALFEEAKNFVQQRLPLIWLKDYGSDVADFQSWNAKAFYFEDPAANILEYICRNALPHKGVQPFSKSSVSCISEIGIVLPAKGFETAAGGFQEQMQLPDFSRQPALKEFKALGDDNGLLILVPEKRIWFGSVKPSRIFEIYVDFENRKKLYHYNHVPPASNHD